MPAIYDDATGTTVADGFVKKYQQLM